MIEVTFRLEELRCVQQYDGGGPSEPYLWVLFFHADFGTVTDNRIGLVSTINMVGGESGRRLLPENIRAGSSINIPERLGVRRIILEENDRIHPLCGFIAALFEENESSDDLIKNGNLEFGRALDEEINEFARLTFAEQRGMTEEEKTAMTGRVRSRVEAAIRRDASAWELLRTKDRSLGVVGETMSWPALDLLHSAAPGLPHPLAYEFRTVRVIPIAASQTIRAVDEYLLVGNIRVSTYVLPLPDPCRSLRAAYNGLESRLSELDNRIRALRSEYALNPARRPLIRAQLMELRNDRAALLGEVDGARTEYQSCRTQYPLP